MQEPCIGIYWFYEGQVIGMACALAEGEEGVPGLVDSRFAHVDAWPGIRSANRLPAHLAYDEVPRGRVLYGRTAKKSLVYGDGALLGCSAAGASGAAGEKGADVRQAISIFFALDAARTVWRHDAHYTLGRRRIDHLLDDDE